MFSRESRVIFLLFQIFGVSPFRINYHTNTITKSTPMVCYSVFLIFLSTLTLLSGCSNPNVIPYFAELSRLFTDVAVFILAFVTLFSILIESIWTHNKQIQVLALLNEIDFTLMVKLRYTMNLKRFSRNIITMCVIIIAFFILQEALSLFVMLQLNQYFVYWSHIIFAIVVADIRTIQIVVFIDMLQARMEMLNNCVRVMIESETEFIANEILGVNLRQKHIESQFMTIKLVFEQLLQVHKLCNDVFGNSMLFIVLQIFIFLCTNSYWSILQHTEKISTIFPVDPVVHIISLTIQLFYMVDRCTKCQFHVRSLPSK